MREIKFRMWIGGKFHYWGFINGEFIGLVDTNEESLTMNQKLERSQQYTGLKDKNGKEIYEGDIAISKKGISWKIIWSSKFARWAAITKNKWSAKLGGFIYKSLPYIIERCEIIGNIHEKEGNNQEIITPKVEFPMCFHPELTPTMWGQEKPEPCRTVGQCPMHDYVCPVCGFGVGGIPSCGCNIYEHPEGVRDV